MGLTRFPEISLEIMDAVDKAGSTQFNQGEILNPKDWVLLNFLMDSRIDTGRFREFRVSNYQLMMELIDYCRDYNIEKILQLEYVKERVEFYNSNRQ